MKQRILVAVVGVPALLAVLCAAPDWATLALLMGLCIIASHELLAAVLPPEKTRRWWGLAATLAVFVVANVYFSHERFAGTAAAGLMPWLLAALVVVVFLCMVLEYGKKEEMDFTALCAILVAGAAIPLALSCLLRLRMLEHGAGLVLIPLVAAFMSDTMALFGGMLFGKTKLAPVVSPKKTREGAVSGLVGGDGIKMRQYAMRGAAMSGGYVCDVIAEALSMAESNACMRRIVAAPTAGACGVLPAVLLPLCNYEELTQHQLLEALYVASGIGAVIAHRACISGAAGGCQAEIGTAAAMAAGALVAIKGGTGAQIGHAVAMALKNLMGLICDPVAGLVEVPCVKRNVIGAVDAVSAADMALAGVESRIPVDEVIDAMGDVGRRMPVEFRETALGGLATTPTGQEIKHCMNKKEE